MSCEFMIAWVLSVRSVVNYTSVCRRNDECLANYTIPWACWVQPQLTHHSAVAMTMPCKLHDSVGAFGSAFVKYI